MNRCVKSATGRAGFTLIELLIIMMIIATLMSLVISAVFTVRESQMKSFTESLVQKLASALDQQWKAAIDQIREEPVPVWALTMGNNDPRLAKVIYLKARLKQEFPVSFYQAIYPNANYLPGQSGAYQTSGRAVDLPPKATYSKALGPLVGSLIPSIGAAIPLPDKPLGMPDGFEASALLYLWLSQGRRGQTGFSIDDNIEPTAIRTATVGGVTFKYFVDSWGNPVRGWTFPYGNNELNDASQPFVNGVQQNQPSPDTQDPDQALLGFQSVAFNNMLRSDGITSNNTPLKNLIPVIASAGRDGLWGFTNYFDMTLDGSPGSFDNIYSYRLRQFGRRGDG